MLHRTSRTVQLVLMVSRRQPSAKKMDAAYAHPRITVLRVLCNRCHFARKPRHTFIPQSSATERHHIQFNNCIRTLVTGCKLTMPETDSRTLVDDCDLVMLVPAYHCM
eukprot:COSAG05_NODE_1235_length_5438_cov_19.332272_3_plen_108_part_00